MSKVITREVEFEVDIEAFSDQELIKEIKVREVDLAEELTDDELKNEISYRGIDIDEDQEELDRDKLSRFSEVLDLLKWEQWNHIFCQVEQESRSERESRPSKYNKV